MGLKLPGTRKGKPGDPPPLFHQQLAAEGAGEKPTVDDFKEARGRETDALHQYLAKFTGKEPVDRKLSVEDLVPNPWNPNKMSEQTKQKVRQGILDLLALLGSLVVPIVVRPHPTLAGKWQIIDGEHRWKIFCEEKIPLIDCKIIEVDDAWAMKLTSALNYLRGEPDADAYAKYLATLVNEVGVSPAEASKHLAETQDEIAQMLINYDHKIEIVEVENVPLEGQEQQPRVEDTDMIELKFTLSREQADAVTRELARLASNLKGKGIQAQALAAMANRSSQAPIDSIISGSGDDPQDQADEEEQPDQTEKKQKLKRRQEKTRDAR